MAVLTQKQIKKIKEIINRNFNTFILFTLGADKLSQTDRDELRSLGLFNDSVTENLFGDAFRIGKTRPIDNKFLPNENYRKWKESIIGMYTSAMDQQTLENIDESTLHYLENLKEKSENRILTSILDANKNAVLDQLGSPVGSSFSRDSKERVNVRELAKNLEEITGDVTRDWKKVVVTELNSAHSQGTIHHILSTKKPDEDLRDILVYCIGPLDGATSPACRKHYHEGGSYKVYRLRDLLANGTNIGKKASAWRAVVPPMHPNCRHRLVELPKGFTLNDEGQVVFIHQNHHELNNDMAIDLRKSLKGKTPTFSGHKLHKRRTYQGLQISVENRKGSYRHWEDRNGKKGKTKMQYDYGYIRNTLSKMDGDHINCYVGQYPEAEHAYIIHQNVGGKFDEDKVMLGFPSKFRAKRAYLKHYNSDSFYGGMTVLTTEELKDRVLGKEIRKIQKGGSGLGSMRANHKYIKRTGGPGNYKYWYKLPDGNWSIKDKDGHVQAGGNPNQVTSKHYNAQIHDDEMRAHPDWEKHAGKVMSLMVKPKLPKQKRGRGRPRKPKEELQVPAQLRRTEFDNTRKVIKVNMKTPSLVDTPELKPKKKKKKKRSPRKERKEDFSEFRLDKNVKEHNAALIPDAQEVHEKFINNDMKRINEGVCGTKGIVTANNGKEYFVKSEVGARMPEVFEDIDVLNNEVAYTNAIHEAFGELNSFFHSKIKISKDSYMMDKIDIKSMVWKGVMHNPSPAFKKYFNNLDVEGKNDLYKLAVTNFVMVNGDRHGDNCGLRGDGSLVLFDEGLTLDERVLKRVNNWKPAYLDMFDRKNKIDYKNLKNYFTDDKKEKLKRSLQDSGTNPTNIDEVTKRYEYIQKNIQSNVNKIEGDKMNHWDFFTTLFSQSSKDNRELELRFEEVKGKPSVPTAKINDNTEKVKE